jgi:hypothetical protein
MDRIIALMSIVMLIGCGSASELQTTSTQGAPTPPSAAVGTAMVTPSVGAAGQAAPSAPVTSMASRGTLPSGSPPSAAGSALDRDALWCGVKRTFDASCTACHNEMKTAGAPMSLKTHADLIAPAVTDPSKKVYQLVGVRVHDHVKPMPPQATLSSDQLAGIDSWIAANAPVAADPACPQNGVTQQAPTVQQWPDNCDDVYKLLVSNGGAPNTVAAGAETHPKVAIAPPWGSEERQLIAYRAINDNMKVLHHWILYGPNGEFLVGWAPGKDNNEPLPADVGLYLPSGGMTLDVHYNNVQGTSVEKDNSGVELCTLNKSHFRPKTASVTNALATRAINIPPRAVDTIITGTCKHSGGKVQLLSVGPHAHRFATHMKFTVVKASGQTIVLHDKDFSYQEQTNYTLTPPFIVESGDQILTACTYTNDTDQVVTFGENTGNEMCFNFAVAEPMNGLSCGFPGIMF